jgi:hypothetical protein
MQKIVEVDVEGDMLIAWLPGTTYRAIYFRSPARKNLTQAKQMNVDKSAPITNKEFEALAWEAANAKARELGWL